MLSFCTQFLQNFGIQVDFFSAQHAARYSTIFASSLWDHAVCVDTTDKSADMLFLDITMLHDIGM